MGGCFSVEVIAESPPQMPSASRVPTSISAATSDPPMIVCSSDDGYRSDAPPYAPLRTPKGGSRPRAPKGSPGPRNKGAGGYKGRVSRDNTQGAGDRLGEVSASVPVTSVPITSSRGGLRNSTPPPASAPGNPNSHSNATTTTTRATSNPNNSNIANSNINANSNPAYSNASNSHTRNSNSNSNAAHCNSSEGAAGRGTARKFRLHELRAATASFSKKGLLGRGSFGEVYRGRLLVDRESGGGGGEMVDVAVKKLNPESSQGLDEWLAEVVLLRKLSHPNLVRLVGYCAEKGEALLVYELCPNGSLDDRLFPRRPEDRLDWSARVRVSQGAAEALVHLHEQKIIHRDLKPSNILLDKDLSPRITDFGMAKQNANSASHVSTRVMGTMGYLDPEYMATGCLREKSDVYSLGIILMQILTGRDAVDAKTQVKLVRWIEPWLHPTVGDPDDWMDPNHAGRFNRRGAMMMAAVAKQCTSVHSHDRPDMSDVSKALRDIAVTC